MNLDREVIDKSHALQDTLLANWFAVQRAHQAFEVLDVDEHDFKAKHSQLEEAVRVYWRTVMALRRLSPD